MVGVQAGKSLQSTTPATKSALQGPQSTAPAAKSALQGPQSTAPATISENELPHVEKSRFTAPDHHHIYPKCCTRHEICTSK